MPEDPQWVGANLDPTPSSPDWKRLGTWTFRAFFYSFIPCMVIPFLPMFGFGFIWGLAYTDGLGFATTLLPALSIPAILMWLLVSGHLTGGHGENWGAILFIIDFYPGILLSFIGWLIAVVAFRRKRADAKKG